MYHQHINATRERSELKAVENSEWIRLNEHIILLSSSGLFCSRKDNFSFFIYFGALTIIIRAIDFFQIRTLDTFW